MIGKDLTFSEIRPGVFLADYIAGPVEVKVVKVDGGCRIPDHHHSSNVHHIVLSGEIEFEGNSLVGPADYICGHWEYRAEAKTPVLMLLVQPVGTNFKFSDEERSSD